MWNLLFGKLLVQCSQSCASFYCVACCYINACNGAVLRSYDTGISIFIASRITMTVAFLYSLSDVSLYLSGPYPASEAVTSTEPEPASRSCCLRCCLGSCLRCCCFGACCRSSSAVPSSTVTSYAIAIYSNCIIFHLMIPPIRLCSFPLIGSLHLLIERTTKPSAGCFLRCCDGRSDDCYQFQIIQQALPLSSSAGAAAGAGAAGAGRLASLLSLVQIADVLEA